MDAVTIDGAMGEGGGQILRTSLALATCLGRPLHIHNIRAARKHPGLQPQHLAAVQAAAQICGAQVGGAEQGSQTLTFTPAQVRAGDYHFAVGTAGSTTLVLQTILPALMLAEASSRIVLEGGTHNPLAPPFEFLHDAFLPVINRMGVTVRATLERFGFAPRGGGRMTVEIIPSKYLQAFNLVERGAVQLQRTQVLLAHLPAHIAQRELAVIQRELDYDAAQMQVNYIDEAYGPGNVVNVLVQSEHITESFCAFGRPGKPAEQVAQEVVNEVRQYLQSAATTGVHLADQLLLPMAMAGSGSFTTLALSNHTQTNAAVIEIFLRRKIRFEQTGAQLWRVSYA
ncbi:MAG: RNA 3'-terminal phosphate cyclase [Gammaproteobacteria bacterium]